MIGPLLIAGFVAVFVMLATSLLKIVFHLAATGPETLEKSRVAETSDEDPRSDS